MAIVSCIVPTFNSERYLPEALDSILRQTYRPIEIIVADDGSTDGTVALVTGYHPQVRLVSQSTQGPAATRNLGLVAAQGEFVAWLDADDLWHPEKLARQMARFAARPALGACITYAQMFWTGDLAEEEEFYRSHPRMAPQPGYTTTTLLARRAVFVRVGLLDPQLWFGDATDWFLRAKEHQVVLEVLPDVLTFHRMHRANLTRRRSQASREEFLHIVKSSLDRRRGLTDTPG